VCVCVCVGLGGGGSELVIDNVSVSDAGVYQCFVSNAAGTVSALATVTVTVHHQQQQPSDIQHIAPHGLR